MDSGILPHIITPPRLNGGISRPSSDALKRMELLALIGAKGTLPSPLIKELIVAGIQKLVFLDKVNGQRLIQSILQIDGKEKDVILTRPL